MVILMRARLRCVAMQRMHCVGIILALMILALMILVLMILILIVLARIFFRLRVLNRRRRLPTDLVALNVRALHPLRGTGRGRCVLFDRLLISRLVLLTRRLSRRRARAPGRSERIGLAD